MQDTPTLIMKGARSSEKSVTSYCVARFISQKVTIFMKTRTNFSLFRRFRKIAKKVTVRYVRPVRLCAWNNSAYTGRIFVEIYI